MIIDGKGCTKNKFEPDRPDHDSHANRAERYLVLNQSNIEAVSNKRQPGDSPRKTKQNW